MATNFSLTALTGINSASTGLGVISNNISNAQTIGFKSSRAEFADLFYGAQNSPGTGSRTQAVTQNFSQGAINDTGNTLDLAISGNGLFIMEDVSGRYEAVYTRNGSFKLDKEGFITDQMGNKLQGFNKDGVLSTPANNVYQTVLGSLNIGDLNKVPKATSEVNFDMNLNGQDSVTYTTTSNGGKQSASGVPFTADKLKDMSYNGAPNYSTSKVMYDSLGGQHRMTVNYYKVAVNAPGAFPTSNAAAGNAVNYSNETTDWYAQYIMEDFDPVTQTWYRSGSSQDSAANATSNANAYTEYQNLVSAGATDAQAKQSMSASQTFGTPTTAQGAAQAAYDMSMSLGATTAQANTARDAVWVSYGGTSGEFPVGTTTTPAFTTATSGFQAATTSLVASGLLIAADKTRLDGTYTNYATTATTWGSDSSRLASLFTVNDASGVPTQPTTAAQAAQAAQAAAIAMGLNASQAAQAAQAAQNGFTGATPAQSAFNAAFGTNGVVTSIPDAVVQAYRFDNNGKLLDFNNNGDFAMMVGNNTPPSKVTAPQNWYFDVPNTSGTVGVTEAMTFESDLTNFTQYAGAYTIRGVTQDGYAAGDLVNVQVNKDGTIEAQYSNGRSDTVAKLALANFSDQQGMQKLGNQMWAETAASGPRQLGNPQASGFGTIQAGALEYSNVDVTGELVNMIFMQKMYQASAQVISTDKTLTQTILQL